MKRGISQTSQFFIPPLHSNPHR